MNRLVERFLFDVADHTLTPRFNIAPSQPVAAVRSEATDSHRSLVTLRWGLIPSWAKEKSIGYKLINVRGETVDQKPSFRQAFKHRRCLLLADGYYEWQKSASCARRPRSSPTISICATVRRSLLRASGMPVRGRRLDDRIMYDYHDRRQ